MKDQQTLAALAGQVAVTSRPQPPMSELGGRQVSPC